tara:strand:+ start:2317 stop:2547 length:231 start_codon:yes stop_codon:yes gene_type:complete
MTRTKDHPAYLTEKQLLDLGVQVEAYIGIDGTLVIGIDTPELPEDDKGPLIRIWLNDETVFENPPAPEWSEPCNTP